MSNEDERVREALTRVAVEIDEDRTAEGRPGFDAAQLQATLNVLPAYTWYAAPRGALIFVNTRTADYLGIPRDHPMCFGIDVGAEWDHSFAMLHPDDREDARKYWASRLRTGEGGEHSYRVCSAQGEYRWFLTRMEPLRASDGTLLLWVGATLDIQEFKCADEALRRSEAYLTDAQRLTHTGSWAWDPLTRRVLYCSDEMFRIFGLDPDVVPTRKMFRERVHPDDRDKVDKRFETSLQQESDGFDEYRIVLPDGTLKHICSLGHVVFDGSGTLVAFVGTAIDVTERKRAEEALRESEYQLRQIIETVPSLVWSLAPDGEPTHFNRRFLDYFGKPFENFKGSGWLSIVHPDDLPETVKAFSQAVQGGISWQVVFRLRRADGEYRWHQGRGEPLRDQQGRVVQWYGLTIDIDEAKKAEDSLRRSEAHLAEAQRLSHTGSAVYNDTRLLYWSDETYRIFEFDPLDGLPGREAMAQRIHPDDRERVTDVARRAVRRKRDYKLEYRVLLPSGITKYIEGHARPKFSTNGELVEVVSTLMDVTQRKRGEDRLRVQHTVASILAEAATIEEATPRILQAMGECLGWDVGLLWRVDREAQVLRCVELWHEASIRVPEFERVSHEFTFGPGLGLPGRVWSSLEPEYIPDVVPDENFPRAPIAEQEGLRAAFGFPILLGGEVLGVIEFFSREIRPPDQELLNVLATIGSQIGQFIERKRGEEALRESEAKFRDYAETASDWLWETGPDHRFTLLTDNAFGSVPVNRVGVGMRSRDHALDLETEPEKWQLLEAALDAHKPFRDFVYCTADGNGSRMHVRASGKPVFDAGGEFRGYRGTGTDVTAVMRAQRTEESLRRTQAELAHVSRLTTLGQLTASISHEVRQPIASARNNARAALNFLERQPPVLAEVKEALAGIVADADRAGQIVDRIGDQIKKAPPRCDRFDLNAAVEEVIALLRGEIASNRVSIRTHLADWQCFVQGDRVQLQQVVMNLVLNAIEAVISVEGGSRELLISTEQDQGEGVLVAVGDSGPGIDPERLERIFEAFYTTKSDGMGMGLSICRSIVDAHGGRLWADTIEPAGMVFRFTLPSEEGASMSSVPERRQSEEPRSRTAPAASRRKALEGNRPRRPSGRGRGQRHSDSP